MTREELYEKPLEPEVAFAVKELCETVDKLEKKVDELKSHIEYLSRERARLEGIVCGLKFAIRCDGVSGGEVKDVE